ncbi:MULTISPECIES: 2-hydroxyacid dehydrogenase [unclassified Sphingobium]|uniref:2-hydroxyacid dehydrogenase n=1 Tax=unclassified Sphingobium TaxID=2611147 RepID=UPI000D17E655|nr:MULTISPECIES: D-glycerate dehydrogenase [unclassified Sphingobium]MBG6120818.1 lactate dehydrogenase-like 2-hydroxyacid dehydrogenase [Sphingobium sp. JAI105]PSO09823.1 D-glycerate dehydrogenase [Sphingobium sp. AEW4]TWC98507.1 lactate dehydrogenase-like 2-hydroxyacid dehydrogenase [Sphingobium sp. AEW010]TWD18325.1 lactate dehydrogenase-like 2-hydroxyacid dehydrogenase [Sphingobium sp. AEW013]TWD20840.1 lactate dehydrogenase-like 2-hydroxyacid dehydrogenase [Sphingobium sp. AEW001]
MVNKPRILVTRKWPERVEALIAQRYDATFNDSDVALTSAQLAAAMRDFDAICPTITDRLDASILGVAGRRVQIIANYGAGVDHIDLAAARAAGIVATNTPGVLTDATADIAITLMLMTTRRAGEGERELRAGQWTGWRPTHLLGTSLRGKTLGLVGFGRIAQAMAERARFGFGMDIVYFSRRPGPQEDEQRLGARFVPSLVDLVAQSDVVSLHIPGGAETRNIIDAAIFAHMAPHAILINTARGDVVDEGALIDALEAGRIGGAGLDVFAGEPHVSQRLRDAPNTVLLPHLGSATRETREAMGMRALANLDDWREGRTPRDSL